MGYSNAKFSGDFADEFEHLAKEKVELINFDKHVESVSKAGIAAISSSKYGYDAQEDIDEDEDNDLKFVPFGDDFSF